MSSFHKVFLIGTSAGGVTALHRLLEALSPEVVAPIIVVQHLPDSKHVDVATVYQAGPSRKVLEIEDKMPIEPHHVYFAPGGYHLLIEKGETFSLTQDEPIRFSRPSIDLSLECAAKVYRRHLVAILLTGANADGSEGLVKVRESGGITVVQDPTDAEFTEMPTAAIARQKPNHVSTLRDLPELMRALHNGEVR